MNREFEYAKLKDLVKGSQIHIGSLSGKRIRPMPIIVKDIGSDFLTYGEVDDDENEQHKMSIERDEEDVYGRLDNGTGVRLFITKRQDVHEFRVPPGMVDPISLNVITDDMLISDFTSVEVEKPESTFGRYYETDTVDDLSSRNLPGVTGKKIDANKPITKYKAVIEGTTRVKKDGKEYNLVKIDKDTYALEDEAKARIKTYTDEQLKDAIPNEIELATSKGGRRRKTRRRRHQRKTRRSRK
jgi:hypothetical protein